MAKRKSAGLERFPVIWVLPALFLILVFTIYPVAHTIWTSLHSKLEIMPVSRFVGLQNYVGVVRSPYFWEALGHSVWFSLISVPLIIGIAYGVARVLLAKFEGRAIVRSVVILPWVLPGAVAGTIWLWIFHPSWGVLNLVLYRLGLIDSYIPWLTDPQLAGLSVIVAHVWMQVPFAVVLLMAALVMIDRQLYEAADLDGVGPFSKFRHVTLPHVKAMIVILAVYEGLISLTTYDVVYGMTAGGPGTATTLIAHHIWKESFRMLNFGNGAALAFIVVALSLLFIWGITKALPSDLFAKEHDR